MTVLSLADGALADPDSAPGFQNRETRAQAPADRLGLLAAALTYIEERHWDVVPGTSVVRSDGAWSCSCGNSSCLELGSHPAHRDWQKQITGQPSRVHSWWRENPEASVRLPTGGGFD